MGVCLRYSGYSDYNHTAPAAIVAALCACVGSTYGYDGEVNACSLTGYRVSYNESVCRGYYRFFHNSDNNNFEGYTFERVPEDDVDVVDGERVYYFNIPRSFESKG